MKVESATFEMLPPEELIGPWVMRVVITGSGFGPRAAPLVATVGDLQVYLLRTTPDGSKASGLLTETPREGARLSVGFLNQTELQETEIAFHAPA